MPDTQWPRFMVFQQINKNDVFVHNGTVHAPDIEMALQYGRDVFVRRPFAFGLWVVPDEAICKKTLQELKGFEAGEEIKPTDDPAKTYHVFGKFGQGAQCEQIGEVYALDPEMALKAAIKKYKDCSPVMWWVFPASAVLASREEDAHSLFDTAESHDFKNQAYYPVITMMRQIKSKGKLEDQDE
jgi:ring-1,2-phenylacetyl-CoA epoxidase subunit PaaB